MAMATQIFSAPRILLQVYRCFPYKYAYRFLPLMNLRNTKHAKIFASLSSSNQVLSRQRSCFNLDYRFRRSITTSNIHCIRNSSDQPLSQFTGSSSHKSKEVGPKKAVASNPLTGFTKLLLVLAKRCLKVLLAVSLLLLLCIAGSPVALSSSTGLHAATILLNKAIPGHVSIDSLSLGWNKPLVLKGFSLKGEDGVDVLTISELKTKASLWKTALGKAGLGDCSISSPVVNLLEEENSGLPNLALALIPQHRLLKSRGRVKRTVQRRMKKREKPVSVALTASIKAPGGGLEVSSGGLILPPDVAAVLGKRVFVDIFLGHLAVKENNELEEQYKDNKGTNQAMQVNVWSDCTEAQASGFLDRRRMEMKLIKPIKVEMDLSPDVVHIYLARVNPLLGEILGPAVQDDDMPDVVLHLSPQNLILPAKHYKVQIEPMKAILGRGPLVGGILNLLSRGNVDPARGSLETLLETSPIEADIGMDGNVECSRIDLLIAGKVHIATWGSVDWIDENVKMTMAITSETLKSFLRLSNLPADCHLKIPLRGTFERPLVDWKTAAIGIAQLSLRQRGGFMKAVVDIFQSTEDPLPEPVARIP